MPETKLKKQALSTPIVPGAFGGFNPAGSTASTTSDSWVYINSNFKATINVTSGELVLVYFIYAGMYHTQSGYSTALTVGMDGTSTVSGATFYLPYTAYSTDGVKSANGIFMFPLGGITPGSHSFYPLWKRNGGTGTSTIQAWSDLSAYAIEMAGVRG